MGCSVGRRARDGSLEGGGSLGMALEIGSLQTGGWWSE